MNESSLTPVLPSTVAPDDNAATDSRIIIACAVASVAMVCLAAAMLCFRMRVLRREEAVREFRKQQLARQQTGVSNTNSISRPVSRTSSCRSCRMSLSSSWPSGAFRRQMSQPPPNILAELRRDSLHNIPNGFGADATIQPPTVITAPGTRPASLPDTTRSDPGSPSRRASWSFENPVFDQWAPPLTKTPELDDDDVFSADDNNFVIDSGLSGDGVSLVTKETDKDTPSSVKDCILLKHPKICKLAGFNASPLFARRDDHPLSLPTLHEREDSSSSGGNETAAEAQTTPVTEPMTHPQSNGTTLYISRERSESIC